MSKVRPGRGLLLAGESFIASTGLAIAAILLLAVGGATWWAVQKQAEAADDARLHEVRELGTLLSTGVEPLIADESTSALRRLVMTAAIPEHVSRCRLVLADGTVVADSGADARTLGSLPRAWEGQPGEKRLVVSPGDRTIEASFPIAVPGRGGGTLEIHAALPRAEAAVRAVQAGALTIGVAGLVLVLLVYRRMRSRLGPMGVIRESLLCVAGGERSTESLAVDGSLGREAQAWNDLLDECDRLRREVLAERAQESLARRAGGGEELQNVFDSMWQGLILIDGSLRTVYANGAAAVFLQARREDMLSQDVTRFFTSVEAVEALRAVVAGKARQRTTIEVERAPANPDDEPGVLRLSIRPVRREDSAEAMIMIEDITQQRVADRARNAFVAQATHELRTPLTNIRLYVEQAVDEGENDAALRAQALNVINKEARRLERIVTDMLSVSEIEAGSLKITRGDVRLETLFDELEYDYRAQAHEKQIDLVFDLPPKLSVIKGDRDRLGLALHNLVGNALKYTPSGGCVAVRVRETGGQLVVEVEDNGIGIGAEDCERIFERFYRARDRRIAHVTGSGLGLALAREVVRLHDGDIAVRSEVDKGTTFTLTVPTLAEAA